MTPATKDDIVQATATAFGQPIDVNRYIDAGQAYAFNTKSGVALFVLTAPATYKITLALTKASGAQRKADIIDTFDWMFANTDADTLVGYIAATNAACLAMVPQTWGFTLTDLADGGKLYTVTKAAWVSAHS